MLHAKYCTNHHFKHITIYTSSSIKHGCPDWSVVLSTWCFFSACLCSVQSCCISNLIFWHGCTNTNGAATYNYVQAQDALHRHMKGSLRRIISTTSFAAMIETALSPQLDLFLSSVCFEMQANWTVFLLCGTFHKSERKTLEKYTLRAKEIKRNVKSLLQESPSVSAGGGCVSWLRAPGCSSHWSNPLGLRKLLSTYDYMH